MYTSFNAKDICYDIGCVTCHIYAQHRQSWLLNIPVSASETVCVMALVITTFTRVRPILIGINTTHSDHTSTTNAWNGKMKSVKEWNHFSWVIKYQEHI